MGKAFFTKVGDRRVAAGLGIGDAGFRRGGDFLFGTGVIDQAHDDLLHQGDRTRRPDPGDLLLDHELEFWSSSGS